ncbi:MAG TPA: cyclic nucleotide-binding domain-containing protein, partial [Deltaproteobacteria bacterium]|nr:cyclic nucleotide-binding domain-containing protein [Deltaproteobacteria bacterium]
MLGALPPVFAGLQPQDAQEAAGFLQGVTLGAGELLMEQGEQDLTLAFIDRGAVQLLDGEVQIGSVGAREMIGEIELFGQMPRVATAIASGEVQLSVLDYEHYVELCNRGNPAVYNLERHSMRRISDRLRWLDEGILDRSQGVAFELHTRSQGLLSRLFGGGVPRVDAVQVLASSPLFSWADIQINQALASEFQVAKFPQGHVLCQQGALAEEMFLIVSGRVDVVLLTSERTAEMVATLGPGQACGEPSMAQHTPRSATYVCREEVIALTLDLSRFGQLFAIDDPLGSTFRQGMLRNMIALELATQRRFVEVESRR